MTGGIPSDLTVALMIVVLILCCVAAAYLFLKGFQVRNDEHWDRRLKKLSKEKSDRSLPNSERTTALSNKVEKKLATNRLENHRFLHSAPSKKNRGHEVAFVYEHLLASWRMDAGKWQVHYIGGKAAGALGAFLVFLIMVYQNYLPELEWIEQAFLFVLFLIAGSYLPEMLVRRIVRHRQKQIEQVAPDVVDLLLLSVEAGMTFDNALSETKSSIALYEKKISRELDRLSDELIVLPNRSDAFNNLVLRTGSETLRYLSVALSQGEKYGTPIAASLRVVAKESRKRNLSDLEKRSNSLPVLMSLPLMLLILPPVIVVSAGPGFVALMRSLGGSG
ncbi:MAG: hypothetical protein COB29_15940 [Sulfitobacter sp.]|nr:MAG: hypothetical protein COB29_15940 [Sulfitobacter sp.]